MDLLDRWYWAAGTALHVEGRKPHEPAVARMLLDPPKGAAAVRLWENVCGWLEFPHVYELKRPKSRADLELIARTFAPYLEARDWVTIQREAP